MAEMETFHQANMQKAAQQAAIIASGQLDATLAGHTVDDEISANLAQIDKAPIGQLAGIKKKEPKPVQSLVQKTEAKKPAVEEEDDEDRDDFEGYGSLTELVKNKDALIEKEMDSPEVKKALEEKHKEEEKEKKAKEEEAK